MKRSHVQESRPRSKTEIEEERRARWEKTEAEIDQLYEDYRAKLPVGFLMLPIAVAYARFSTRFQDSIADQIACILNHALKLNVYVPRNMIFFDLAISGVKKRRAGLDQVEAKLRGKEASVLLLFSTSRLFRKQYRTLEFVDRMHKGLGIRCVFVKSGVDTDDKQRWQSILAVQSMIDQFVVTMYVANIHAAHEGLLKKQLVFGTLPFGYRGEPIEGEFTRLGRPRCTIVIDEECWQIVCTIFCWYVDERLSIDAIVQRLNGDCEIPVPQLARSRMWTRTIIRRLLTNSRYRGKWSYGVMEAIYVPDGDYTAQKMRSEPLAEVTIEDLRIVSDEVWAAAQQRLSQEANRGGRRAKDSKRPRPKLLRRLLVCGEHKCPLRVGGPHGLAMHCPICTRFPAAERALYSTLNRELATQLISNRIAELINSDHGLAGEVLQTCAQEAAVAHQPDARHRAQLQARIDQLGRTIAFTRRSVGPTAEDENEANMTVSKCQAERAQLQGELAQLNGAEMRAPKQPTEKEVKAMLRDLGKKLVSAASSDDEAEVERARHIIELVTGGSIELFQAGERKRHHGWLQARFKVALVPYLVHCASGMPLDRDGKSIEVAIDIVRPDEEDEEVEKAWELAQENMLCTEIANELGCGKSKVTKLLKTAAQRHGEEYVDGRTRRATLAKKHTKPPKYQQIADRVVELSKGDWLLEEIAVKEEVDRNTITAAIHWWYTSRNMPVPDSQTRRWEVIRARAKSVSPEQD